MVPRVSLSLPNKLPGVASMPTPFSNGTPCFGVGCRHHERCARYARVDGYSGECVGTCDPGDGTRPGFESVHIPLA